MADSDLEQIRARRLAQMRASSGGSSGGSFPGGIPNLSQAGVGGDSEQAANQHQQQEEQRHNMLYSVMDASARERLSTIKIVNPQKGKMVEDMLIYQVRTGQLRTKVSDTQLVSMLENIDESERPKTTITFQRRASLSDSDDDW